MQCMGLSMCLETCYACSGMEFHIIYSPRHICISQRYYSIYSPSHSATEKPYGISFEALLSCDQNTSLMLRYHIIYSPRLQPLCRDTTAHINNIYYNTMYHCAYHYWPITVVHMHSLVILNRYSFRTALLFLQI
jgi:hypothetical protein